MPDFNWLTVVSYYDQEGYVHQTPLELWSCDICGAVVEKNQTMKHLYFHAES